MKRISLLILFILLSFQILAQNKNEVIWLESEIHTEGNIFNFKLKDDYLFINDINTIKIYDLNSIEFPVLIDTLTKNCVDFKIVDSLAFCLSNIGWVQIFNISNCKDIALISEWDINTIGEPIRIEVIENTILIFEEKVENWAGSIEYYYYMLVINIDEIDNPRVIERIQFNSEPAGNNIPKTFISLSDFIYFNHINLGRFIYKVNTNGISIVDIFPSFDHGKFYGNVFYLGDDNNLYLYRLNEQNQFEKFDSLVNENQFSFHFDVYENFLVQGFIKPFELKAFQYLENSSGFEEIGSFQNYANDAHIQGIAVDDEIIIVSLDFERILVFSHDFKNYSNINKWTGFPNIYSLSQNYPNPFNPITIIDYQIPSSGWVTLKVYNLLGEEIETLVDDFKQMGKYSVKIDASNLASGSYLYRLEAEKFKQVGKMLLIK